MSKMLTHARKDIGLREIKGPATAPRLSKILAKYGAWWRDDETPWCGNIMAAWADECGHDYPKHYYRALAWATWGMPSGGPVLGAVAVLSRNGGGHVGMVSAISQDGLHVRLLGGNQGNAVSEAWFPVHRVSAYRVPYAARWASAPVLAVGNISKSEA